MLCCQIDRDVPSPLPFKSTLFKGFYDGPTDGLTTCEICKQGFIFRVVEYIDCAFRIYSFTKIPINHYEFADNFGSGIFTNFQKKTMQRELLEDFPRDEQAEKLYTEFENLPFTHICLMGGIGYFNDVLLWKKACPNDFIKINCMEDWMDYFGITFDPEAEEYHSLNKIWEKFLEKYLNEPDAVMSNHKH